MFTLLYYERLMTTRRGADAFGHLSKFCYPRLPFFKYRCKPNQYLQLGRSHFFFFFFFFRSRVYLRTTKQIMEQTQPPFLG